jgi:hypothetical protein
MALRPQTSPIVQELVAIGVMRQDKDEQALVKPDGTMMRGVHVPDAVGANPTKAEFDALLTSLRNAGFLASS